jgi:hypothetical protein
MIHMLQSLEPRYVPKRTVILDEFDECNEIMFVCSGSVLVGYEVNNVKKYCIKMDRIVVGGHGVIANKRSEFVYCSLNILNASSIRKENWKKLIDEHPDMAEKFSIKILTSYLTKTKSKCMLAKKRAKQEMMRRNDFNMVKLSEDV